MINMCARTNKILSKEHALSIVGERAVGIHMG